jgi:HAD superfamily phosphatase (TIGR01668 family)
VLSRLRPKLLRPDLRLRSVADIDIAALRRRGVLAVMFDVDNTLCRHGALSPDCAVERRLQELVSQLKAGIITNSDEGRRHKLASRFPGMAVIHSPIKKPYSEPFRLALEHMQMAPQQLAMVGDRLLTDIAGAKKMSIFAIKVEPLDCRSEPLGIRLSRKMEGALLTLYENRRWGT